MEGVGAQVSVLPVARGAWRGLQEWLGGSPMLAALAGEEALQKGAPAAPADREGPLAALAAAAPEERRPLLAAYLRQQVARVLGIPPARLDLHQRLDRLGIDSLMAVEIKNRIEQQLRVTLPLMRLIQGPTVSELAGTLLDRLESREAATPAPPEEGRPPSPILTLLHSRDREPEA
jgi:acyl carrier protein